MLACPAHKPGLALLDPLLPGIDGIELLEQDPDLRDLPVIFISAFGRNEAIVRALGTSAADCIVKPLSPSELTARVRSALRWRGRPVELAVTEFELLRVLSVNQGRALTSGSLLRQAWGRDRSKPPTRSWCAPSRGDSARSWATTQRAGRTFSTSARTATGRPNRAIWKPSPLGGSAVGESIL